MAIPSITLGNIWKIYYYIAIFATVLFVIKMAIFAIVGHDSEVVSDFNTEIDMDTSFNFFSTQSIIAFFMGFGWMGYGGLQQLGFTHYKTLLFAIGVGLVFMFVSALLMYWAKRLEQIITKDKTTAVQKVGKAYTNFEPKGMGQIEIEISGQLSVVEASNLSDVSINAFEQIRVVKVENDLLYIEKVVK